MNRNSKGELLETAAMPKTAAAADADDGPSPSLSSCCSKSLTIGDKKIKHVVTNFVSTVGCGINCNVTITCACGEVISAHSQVLSMFSIYFKKLFKDLNSRSSNKDPMRLLANIEFIYIKSIIDYIYHGEISFPIDQLKGFMKTAKKLRIKGLYNRHETQESQEKELQQALTAFKIKQVEMNVKQVIDGPGVDGKDKDKDACPCATGGPNLRHKIPITTVGGHCDGVRADNASACVKKNEERKTKINKVN